jgi:MFS family permease
MLTPLRDKTYRYLFCAQVLSLMGTGLATVALGLLAYDLAGSDAGVVLGTALFIKMAAYVTVAPVVGGFVGALPRRALLVALDVIRAGIVLVLPWVDQVWQIYVLILVLQIASAAFTPTFQATIPAVLPDEGDYTKALSLSRVAYDLENLLSPMLAAALLTVIEFHWLFGGTALGFLASAILVATAGLSIAREVDRQHGFLARTTRGVRVYLATPHLRGFLGFNLAISAGSAFVIVNTVVFVRGSLGGSDGDVAISLGAFGAGSMLMAFILPRIFEHRSERLVIAGGAILTAVVFSALGSIFLSAQASWELLLIAWFLAGGGFSAVLTPIGRLLRRAVGEADLPAIFAAQFALTHLSWLLTYPLAGYLGGMLGLPETMLVMGGIAWIGIGLGFWCWPRHMLRPIEPTDRAGAEEPRS